MFQSLICIPSAMHILWYMLTHSNWIFILAHAAVCYFVIPFAAMVASSECHWIKRREEVLPIEEVAIVVFLTIVFNLLVLLCGSAKRLSTILTGMIVHTICFGIIIGWSVHDKAHERVHEIFMDGGVKGHKLHEGIFFVMLRSLLFDTYYDTDYLLEVLEIPTVCLDNDDGGSFIWGKMWSIFGGGDKDKDKEVQDALTEHLLHMKTLYGAVTLLLASRITVFVMNLIFSIGLLKGFSFKMTSNQSTQLETFEKGCPHCDGDDNNNDNNAPPQRQRASTADINNNSFDFEQLQPTYQQADYTGGGSNWCAMPMGSGYGAVKIRHY